MTTGSNESATATSGDVPNAEGLQPVVKIKPTSEVIPAVTEERELHLVQFSTGLGSAEAAYRCVEKYGADRVVLLSADTRVEDGDNWRFAHEVVDDLGPVKWEILADGRTPMSVGRDKRVVPNDRLAVCSRILKRELLRDHIDANYSPEDTMIEMGFDWTETHRLYQARPHWQPFLIDAPLCHPPLHTKHALLERMRERGIEPPRLYAAGFSHANCGGACVRGGQAQWERLLRWNRERYLEWEAEEKRTRKMLDKNVSILIEQRDGVKSPLTLKRFRKRVEKTGVFVQDEGACGCFVEEDEGE